MSVFVDNNNYYFNLISTSEGMKLQDTITQELIPIDYELLDYYLNHYTIQKGLFVNSFRKIFCDDGETRFYGKENEEYKKAIKAETLSIKNVNLGDSLMLYGNSEVFYIGSFYKKGRNPVRMHAFLTERNNEIRFFTNLKNFTEISRHKNKYEDRVNNYKKYISNMYMNYYFLTREEAK